MSDAPSVSPDARRFLALDSLRGILACTIVVYHLPSQGWMWRLTLIQNGFLSVTFFFVLSGFVIGNTYGDRLAVGFPMARFLGLRLGRIYPLHLFMIALLAAYSALRMLLGWSAVREGMPFTGSTAPQALPSNFFLLQKFAPDLSWNTPSWSIGVEWWTYCIFASVAAFCGNRYRLFPVAFLLMAPWGDFLLSHRHIQDGWQATADCMLSFGFGLLICEFRRSGRASALMRRLGYWSVTAIELCAILLALWMIAQFGGKLSPLITPVFAIGIAVFSFEGGVFSRLLVTAPMLMLGELSYSIYMIHHFVLDRCLDLLRIAGHMIALPLTVTESGRTVLTGNPVACDLFSLAILVAAVLLSRLSHRFIEVPARLWSRRRVNPSHGERAKPRDPTAAF